MTSKEIKEKIDANNDMIKTLMKPNTFVLNPVVQNLIHENFQLQQQCKHEFENGICKYCYVREEDCL